MTTNTKRSKIRIYPGLTCGSIEFFIGPNGKLKVMSGGKVKELKHAPYSYHQILKETIEQEPEIHEILQQWYPKSELKRLIQFGACRFGGLDFQPDFKDYKLQEGEFHECEVREECPAAGILCKFPKINGVTISFFEVKILQALSTIDTNERIAENLGLPLGTFHLLKKKLYQKLNIQTKPEAVMIGRDHNLI